MKQARSVCIAAGAQSRAVAAVAWLILLLAPSMAWAVNVAQSPLTTQLQLQPNMTLMFDDSGSMQWNAMPDSLSNTNVNEGFISGDVNGVYYNPLITYRPPYTETATPPTVTTRMADSAFASAPFDGFSTTSATTNIGTYNTGSNPIEGFNFADSTCVNTSRCRVESVNFGEVNPAFTNTFEITVPETYGFASAICSTGATSNFSSSTNPGTCSRKNTADPVCPANYTRTGTGTSAVRCQANTSTPTCSTSGYAYNSTTANCERVNRAAPTCSTGTLTGAGTTSPACLEVQNLSCTTTANYTTLQTGFQTTASGTEVKGWCRKGNGRETNNTASNVDCNVATSNSFRTQCFRDDATCPTGFTKNRHATGSDSTPPRCERTGAVTPACPSGFSADFGSSTNPGTCAQTLTETPSCASPLLLSSDRRSCAASPATLTPTCPAASNPSSPEYMADFSDADTPGKCERLLPEAPICPASRFSYTPNLLSDSTGGLLNPNTSSVQCRGAATASSTLYRSLFVYATLSGGTYTRHFVGAASVDTTGNGTATAPKAGTCGEVTTTRSVTNLNTSETFATGLPSANCDGSDTARQNVANWFSYYRTRLLMAKSGLMNAFVDLGEDIRFGFSSINAGTNTSVNGSALPTPKTNTNYTQSIGDASYAPPIAKVKRFGDGSSSSRRGEFWNWIKAVSAPGSTPLRAALRSVGDYYQTDDQPWISGADAPECSGKTGSERTTCGNRLLACRQSYSILVTDGFWNNDNVTLVDGNYVIDGTSYFGNWDGGPGGSSTTVQTSTPSCSGTFNNLVTSSFTLSGTNYKGQCFAGTARGSSCNSGSASFSSACFRDTATCPSGSTLNKHIPDNGVLPSCDRTVNTGGASVTNTGPNSQSYIYTGLPPYSGGQANNGSSTLADVAMFFWLKDLRSDLANSVPTNSDDPAFWQHMTTFTVGMFGQEAGLPNVTPAGTTAQAIEDWAKGGAAISGFAWPTPNTGGTSANISDLVHAGINGRGGFYSAGNPDAFASGIKDALRRVRDRIGSGASLAANSTKLDTGTTTYQAVYFSGEWKGNLRAFAVDPSDGSISTTAIWDAATQLPTAANRVIKTCRNTCTGDGDKINFDTSTATTAQRTALASTTAAQDGLINYLRGSAALEARNGGTLRDRSTPLGDIVNSQPVFVGAPDPNLYFNKSFTGSDSYFAFTASHVSRKRRIYVAANDGMLHGFSSETAAETGQPAPGQETFAYLPSAVIQGNLKNLGNPTYGSGVAHEFFNDGELTIADVYLNGLDGCTGSSCWRTVLIGTTGRGLSKAIYALDVTDPANVKLLWERSAGDSTDIGQIAGKPVIAQTADGVWSVLVGNGYNSADNKPALLQVNVRTGALTVYETTGSATNDGLAQPAVWIGNATQNISTEAYAGDLNGNVWKFDLTSPGSAGTKIYVAKDGTGNTQPITAGMIAGKNPKVTSEVWVFFGTGSALEDFAPSTAAQTWYGLIVQGSNAVGAATARGDLRQRTIDVEFAADTTRVLATRGISSATANDMAGKKGWYIDLLKPNPDRSNTLAQGERMVTPNQFQGSLLLGTSRIPADSATFDPCNPSGTGWIMAIDAFTGTPPGSNFFDVNNDGSFNNSDNAGGGTYVTAGVGFGSIANNPIFVGNTMLISFDNATTGAVNTSGTVGDVERLSWRELVAP